MRLLAVCILLSTAVFAQLKSGPPLNYKTVEGWAKLPEGWNFGECSGVAVDNQDNVWVFNRGAHPVIVFDRDGKFLKAWKEIPVKSAHGIRVDKHGDVWMIDVEGNTVLKFSPDGRLKMVFGNPRGSAGGPDDPYAYSRPTGISFASNGDFFVSDGYGNSRVAKYTPAGIFVRQWGLKGKGDGQFDLVHDVAVDGKDVVYVADRVNERVQVFDKDGKYITQWNGLGAPWGLIYSPKENVLFMCDGKYSRVLKLNLDGQVLGVMGEFGKLPGKLDFAHNIAVDSRGDLYVAEIKNWRVQKFAKP